MKKEFLIFTLFLELLCLTGCTAKFDVYIGENSITENASIYMKDSEITHETPLYTLRNLVSSVDNDTEMMSRFEVIGNKNSNPLRGYLLQNIDDYPRGYALYYCYDNQNITYSNNILKIETSNYFNCFDKYSILDDVNINVTTGYKVLENNADKVDGNTYTWNITKTNKKGIKLTLDTTVDEIQEEEKQKENLNKNLIFIVIGTLVLFAFGTVLFVFIKSNKNNKI